MPLNAVALDNRDNRQPYALAKLEESARMVRQAVGDMPLYRKRLEKHKTNKPKAREVYGDLQSQQRRLLTAFDDAVLALLEMDEQDLAAYTAKLKESVSGFNLLTPDYAKLCAVLDGYISQLPAIDTPEAQTTNAAIIGRLMNNVRLGYYPTDLEHVGHIARGIAFPEGITVNALDPCCGCGLALHGLALHAQSNGGDCTTYGVELDNLRAEEAQGRLTRVGFGSYFHSRISNEAFHLMLLNPPYLSVMTQGGNNTRSEKRFLVDSLYHLMYGGLLVYIIPHYRLTADICRVLADNFEDLTVWRFMGKEFTRFKQVAIMGTRRKRCDGYEAAQSLASLVLSPDNLPELSELPSERYALPATAVKVSLFKGAQFNVAELAEQLNRSTSFTRLFAKNKLDSEDKRPLLPLNIGQVGLIGGSGLINGLVECDTPHIVKGRIIKQNSVSHEENRDAQGQLISTTLTETRSNKMVFNLLTPQGFRSLADYDSAGANDGNSIPRAPSDVNARIELGRTVVTANAAGVLTDEDINTAIKRHQSGDWGDVEKADWRENDRAVKQGCRIVSSYKSASGEAFWIITEWDRSCTTVLLPEDY